MTTERSGKRKLGVVVVVDRNISKLGRIDVDVVPRLIVVARGGRGDVADASRNYQ